MEIMITTNIFGLSIQCVFVHFIRFNAYAVIGGRERQCM